MNKINKYEELCAFITYIFYYGVRGKEQPQQNQSANIYILNIVYNTNNNYNVNKINKYEELCAFITYIFYK